MEKCVHIKHVALHRNVWMFRCLFGSSNNVCWWGCEGKIGWELFSLCMAFPKFCCSCISCAETLVSTVSVCWEHEKEGRSCSFCCLKEKLKNPGAGCWHPVPPCSSPMKPANYTHSAVTELNWWKALLQRLGQATMCVWKNISASVAWRDKGVARRVEFSLLRNHKKQ